MQTDLIAIDLFAGCGGGALGFLQRGFRIGTGVEIDADAAEAFRLNTGVTPIGRDVRLVTGGELLRAADVEPGDVALLFGCPPCQSFSIMRHGTPVDAADRRRNELPREYLRLVRAIRPRHLAFENVPGMVAGRWKADFESLISSLFALGYKSEWRVVDAADYGVPQRRKRLLVVGSRSATVAFPEPTHSRDGRGGNPKHATVRDAIGWLRPLAPGETDPHDHFHKARRHSPIAIRRLQAIAEGGARRDLPQSLQLACHKNHDGHNDVYGRMWWDRPAPTLTSGCTNVTRGRFGHPDQDRAISLREAMLLQTLPMNAVLHGTEGAMALQVGNAIPTRLAEAIADAVLAMERAQDGARRAG